MSNIYADGRIIDAILALMLLEAAGFALHHRRTGRGIATADLLPNLAAGVCLLLALRAALTGWSAVWIALALTGALLAHTTDLRRRWRSRADTAGRERHWP